MSLQLFIDKPFYRARCDMDLRTPHQHSRIGRCLVLLLVALVTAGCSSTKLTYRYADWGIVWWVEDYVTLTDEQERQLSADLETLMQWHCSSELPRYQEWLAELESDVAGGPPEQGTVSYHQQRLFAFFPELLERITPVAANLLSTLSDRQVKELAENMARSQRETREEFLAETPEKTARARAERTADRMERWLGPLSPQQQEIIDQWSANRESQTEIWLQGRRNWQQALLERLEERRLPDFEERLRPLIVHSERARGQDYQMMMADSREAMATLIHELIQAGNNNTLAHLKGRASDLREDFAALACAPA